MDERKAPASAVAGNTAALLGGRLATAIVGLLTVPPVYAILGQRRFGLWVLLLGASAILGLIDFGLGSAQVREVARVTAGGDPRRSWAVLALGMITLPTLALAFLASTAAGWPLFAKAFHLGAIADEGRAAALILLASLAIEGFASPWRAILEGTQRFRSVALITSSTATVGAVGGVAMVASGHGLPGLAWSLTGASVLRFCWLFVGARRSAPEIRPSMHAIDRIAFRSLLRYGWRVQISNTAAVINNDSDRLILGAAYNPSAVAPFDLGSRMANIVRLLPTFFLIAVFPAAASMHARRDRARIDRLYLRSTRFLAAFSFVAAAFFVVSAEPLVVLWLGEPIPMAATTIALLAPGYAVNLSSGAATAVARAEGTPGRETRYALLAAGLNVVLTVPLLVAFGTAGVPLATSVAYVAATAYFFRHFHVSSGRAVRPILPALCKPFAAAGFSAVVSWLTLGRSPAPSGRLTAGLVVAGRAGLVAALSLFVLAALRFFDDEDRRDVARLLGRLRRAEATRAPAHATRSVP